MQSLVVREDLQAVAQANELKMRADLALENLTEKGEATQPQVYDDAGNLLEVDDETLFDTLVPGFFR